MEEQNLLDTFFPKPNDNIFLNRNYTDETIQKMVSVSKAHKVAEIINNIMVPKVVIDCNATLGGNTLAFGKNSKVISYEPDRETWTMLCNNVLDYKLNRNVFCYNQEFCLNEDLSLLGYTPEETVIFMRPPSKEWKSKKSLETWGKLLKDYICVVFLLPANGKIYLKDALIDDNSLFGNRLVFYTQSTELKDRLKRELIIKDNDIDEKFEKELEKFEKELEKFEKELEKLEKEVPTYKKELEIIPEKSEKGLQLHTFLQKDFPQREYKQEYPNPKIIPIAERKLLLSDIEFLTRVLKKTTQNTQNPQQYTVIYLSPTKHIYNLSEMFPEFIFHIYDNMDDNIKETARIKILTEDILTIKRKDDKSNKDVYLFINGEKEVSLEKQKTIVETLKPYKSLLKFKLPFDDEETEYFDGVLWFQAYGKAQEAEVRLEISSKNSSSFLNGHSPFKNIEYSNQKFNQQLFYYNTVYRIQPFRHYHSKFGWSYDTVREYFVIKSFLTFRGRGFKDIEKYIKEFDDLRIEPEKKILNILK